jgi:hypothetical protein
MSVQCPISGVKQTSRRKAATSKGKVAGYSMTSSASVSIVGGMLRPRALAVASGDKDVVLATVPVNVTHPDLIRRLAWDIPLKNV